MEWTLQGEEESILISSSSMSNTNVSFSEKKKKIHKANTFEMESGCDSIISMEGMVWRCRGVRGGIKGEERGAVWLCQFLYDIIILGVINSGTLRSLTTAT